MKNNGFRFRTKAELVSWLDSLLISVAQLFEKQYNLELKLFEQSDYWCEHGTEANLFKLILMVVNKIEFWHTNKGLLTATNQSQDIWKADAFIFLAREIIKVSEYVKPTKDSKRPDSKKHIESKNRLLTCDDSCWKDSNSDFKAMFNWVIKETELPISIKKTSPKLENDQKKWWIIVNVLMLNGTGKTKAQAEVGKHFCKEDIRKEFNKVENSNWAKGAGLLTFENIFHTLKKQHQEITISQINQHLE
ncbi:hypothetical protein Q4519_06685 [Motilimonas sp. 1_MG-2023]|uniref:hypothetical protein n=1 Tax=Motilimonas sp. 1_MG-2023 TaxID=3062672 RepID=UPI0026E38C10|nr:hypothetical protein [Motilimonas sp. 1_MG-2023]MDO6525369.1 hypothetical protein [Motilimonas sp. 1_MG-2023]